MLRLERVSKIYATGEVLKDVSWEVRAGEKVGLVGVNGAGKSTQLKIVLGEEEPTSGKVARPHSLKVAYLAQEFIATPGRTVKQELWTAFDEALLVLNKLERVKQELEAAPTDAKKLEKLLKDLDTYQRRFEALNGYALDSRIEKLMPDLGFEPGDTQREVTEFSGGWQMRMGLGKILLSDPDLLLLDEPTNHLDLETIEWLEDYLKACKPAVVVISHDRRFLDKLVNKVIETERGVASTYLGNYSAYLAEKERRKESQLSAFERQQKELEKQERFIERFRASATRSTQAKSREKQLDKKERIEAPVSDVRGLKFRFPPAARSSNQVVKVADLTLEFNENPLFIGAELIVERGDRIALLGPNGCGKSTFLRFMVGTQKALEGEVSFGHNVQLGYFAQHQAEALPLDRNVLETLRDSAPNAPDGELRGLAGRFLFTGDGVFKKVRALSGGEKSRLALARLLLEPANFLLLDEPTNHLDIPAKETLEEALCHYEGTAVIVSHDRYFIQRVANKIVEIVNGEFVVYLGGYDYYLEKKANQKESSNTFALELAYQKDQEVAGR
jgi:ATP-binding cassette, subfamily F, member 3